MANAVDYSSITSAVDWSTCVTGLLAVGSALALVFIARKGIDFILGMIDETHGMTNEEYDDWAHH